MCKLTHPNTLKEGQGNAAPATANVRSPDEYASGHVPGAVNIPIDELEQRLTEIPQNRPVVTYCNMYHPGSSRGERAADLLESLGFRARALNGGYPAWLNETEKDKPDE